MSLATSTVSVAVEPRGYEIQIGSGLLKQAGTFVQQHGTFSKAVIVTDDNVVDLIAHPVAQSIANSGYDVEIFTIPAGEEAKSIETVFQLWQNCLQVNLDRQGIILAVGGGVVGDLAGFIAATYARGITFYQIPTTLLAQVDSSVGGKTGINLPDAKNMVGAFWQPAGVLIDTDVLSTLPDRQYRAGLAEVVKYGMILDETFFCQLEAERSKINERAPEILKAIITRSCQLKAKVVELDERETTGERAKLNYGHTFGHALEVLAGYGQLLHGEAVAIGMILASRLAEKVRGLSSDITQRQEHLLHFFGLPTKFPLVDPKQMVELMRQDKKGTKGELNFILPDQIGQVDLVRQVDSSVVLPLLHNDST